MRFFHGTSSSRLAGILSDGILPRSEVGYSNYDAHLLSKDNFIYLTLYYAAYYAGNTRAEVDDDRGAIVEVEVDESLLYPDEDFIAKVIHRSSGGDLLEITQAVDPRQYKRLYSECLYYTGNCCHLGAIHADRIVRYAEIPNDLLFSLGGDMNPMGGLITAVGGMESGGSTGRRIDYFLEHGADAYRDLMSRIGERISKGKLGELLDNDEFSGYVF